MAPAPALVNPAHHAQPCATAPGADNPVMRIKDLLRQGGIFVQRQIGTGTHSRVYQALSTIAGKPGTTTAIKLIDKRMKGEYIDRFMERELSVIKRLDHPNIVKVWGIFRTLEFVAINEEFAENGDLLHYIRQKHGKHLIEPEAQFLFRQLIEAIIYLERHFILHRDLKCENIFLDNFYNVKLGDFGFSRELHPGDHSNTHCGSKPYAAVELLTGQTYRGNGVDIWSAGVCCYVMLTGCFPYGGAHEDVDTIVKRQRMKTIKFPSRISENATNLILKMVEPKVTNRATTKEILDHPWVAPIEYKMKPQQ